MAMMLAVVVVVAHHPAVILGTKSVIDKSQVVLGDRAARVLPYLFADESFSKSTTHLGCLVYNLAQPPGFLHLWIIAQIGHHAPCLSAETHHSRVVECISAALPVHHGKSAASPLAEYVLHSLTENAGLQ